MKTFLKVIGVIFLLLLVVIIGTGVYFYSQYKPYFTMPDVDEVQLEAANAEYSKLFREYGARPKDDHEAISAYIENVKLKNKDDNNLDYYPGNFCDQQELDKALEGYKDALQRIEANMPDLEKALEGGLILPAETVDDLKNDKDIIINFLPMRNFSRVTSVVASEDAKSGNSALAVKRLMRIDRIAAGIKDCPMLIHVMIGKVLDVYFINGFLASMPYMSSDELNFLLKNAQVFNHNLMTSFIDSLKLEAAWSVEMVDYSMANFLAEPGTAKLLGMGMKIPWLAKRERINLLETNEYRVSSYTDWAKDQSKPMPPDWDPNDTTKGLLTDLMMIKVSKLADRIIDDQKLVAAAKIAIQKELARRDSGSKEPFEVPLDDTRKIMVDDKRGCVVDIETDAYEDS